MPDHPLLVFPEPTLIGKARRFGGGRKIKIPDPKDQAGRIAPKFERLQRALDARRAVLQNNPLGIIPEQVLVIETIGSPANFVKAAQAIGLEWVGEVELEDVEPDFGFQDEKNPEKSLDGRLFLMLTDQRALADLRRMFVAWQDDPDSPFPKGLAPLRNAFRHLRDIRPWSAEDRIRDTGLMEDWSERVAGGQTSVPFEAELWYRNSADTRRERAAFLAQLVENLGGEILTEADISEIAYHAVIGRIPIEHVNSILALDDVGLVRSEDVMHFRPTGQCAFPLSELDETELTQEEVAQGPIPEGEPLVALLDGLPLAGHVALSDRLIIDDPDDFEDGYLANAREHGTSMASLICNGDLQNDLSPLPNRIYVRPILRPVSRGWGRPYEGIPEDVLPVDLIYRSVRRMFERDGENPPVAPSVKVVNLSVGDPVRLFNGSLSPWARLLDWLAWEYNILFVVSTGNCTRPIQTSNPREDFNGLAPDEIQACVISAVAADTRHRAIMAPAEAMNALTVGSEHSDGSTGPRIANTVNPFLVSGCPSVVSSHGPGYRRSIKPDILSPGGRQLLRERLGNTHVNAVLDLFGSTQEPGQKVATPGPAGELDRFMHTRGTSNAAALITRGANRVLNMIDELRGQDEVELPVAFEPVLTKALIVHGADWSDADTIFEQVLRTPDNGTFYRDYVSRFYGYGSVDIEKVLACSDQRVTILGMGELNDGDAHEYAFPLPPSLSAVRHKRRLTATLAWFSPINSRNQKYRLAQLWFDQKNDLAPTRINADHAAVQRGTVQHEVFEGERAVDFQDGDVLAIRINCREDAGPFDSPIKYGLVVTLEVGADVDLPIYEEVQTRLPVPVPIPL